MPFIVGYFLFYSAILGFLGYHWFPLFTPLGTRTNAMSATLVASPFLILHYFLLLRFPLQIPPANFPVLGGPRGLTFDLSFSKTYRFHLFRPTFWLLSPFSFFSNELIPFYQAKTSPATFFNGPSSWVPWGTRPLLISCWFLSLLILFLHHWMVDGTYLSSFSMFLGMPPLNCLSPNLALLHIPGS